MANVSFSTELMATSDKRAWEDSILQECLIPTQSPLDPLISGVLEFTWKDTGASMKFTQATIAKLKMPKDKLEHLEFDDDMPGFGLQLRKGGNKERRTYILQYKIGPKQHCMTLGNARKIELEGAQRTAR